jgi:hypothetical protein
LEIRVRIAEFFGDDPYEPTCCGAVPCQWGKQGKEPCMTARHYDYFPGETTMSDTPRTDAFEIEFFNRRVEVKGASTWDFARQLERELRDAQTEITRLNRFFITSGHD